MHAAQREGERSEASRRGLARDMRLSRNRGNARGPTRLTNPLRRAMSCSARLSALPPNPPLRYSLLFLFPLLRLPEGTPFFLSFSHCFALSFSRSLGLSAIPPTFSPFAISLPTCPPLFPPLRPPFTLRFLRSPAQRILFAFPSSTIHPPPYSSSATPSPLLFPRLLFRLCPPLRSSISSPYSHRRSARYILLLLLCLPHRHRRLVVFFFFFFVREPWSSPVGIFHICYRITVEKCNFLYLTKEKLPKIEYTGWRMMHCSWEDFPLSKKRMFKRRETCFIMRNFYSSSCQNSTSMSGFPKKKLTEIETEGERKKFMIRVRERYGRGIRRK